LQSHIPAIDPRPHPGMAWVPGGSFFMGSNDFYPEERPVRRVQVEGFWLDVSPVMVLEFQRFVQATGYVTVAEQPLDPTLYPDADPDLLVPGSLVFQRARGPVDLRDYRNWWAYVPGASWRTPGGPGSTTDGREQHPVTHVAYEDALAYAAWAGKALPSEAEWEYAARGGLDRAVFAWGNVFAPDSKMMANTWQGQFPWQNLALDGFESTSPVGSFPPNGYGLYDMTGNVWEWTSDRFIEEPIVAGACPSCAPAALAPEVIERRVIKGGSHLCAPNYCLRYRPAARQAEAVDTSTCHLGFRCIIRDGDREGPSRRP
jgi:sulfatase modifying factor 1